MICDLIRDSASLMIAEKLRYKVAASFELVNVSVAPQIDTC